MVPPGLFAGLYCADTVCSPKSSAWACTLLDVMDHKYVPEANNSSKKISTSPAHRKCSRFLHPCFLHFCFLLLCFLLSRFPQPCILQIHLLHNVAAFLIIATLLPLSLLPCGPCLTP